MFLYFYIFIFTLGTALRELGTWDCPARAAAGCSPQSQTFIADLDLKLFKF